MTAVPEKLGLPEGFGLPDGLGLPEGLTLPETVGLPEGLTLPEGVGAPDASAEQLARVRTAIDALDQQLVELIAAREQLVRVAGTLKRDDVAVRAADRVEQVITRVRARAAEAGADENVVEQTYRAMIGAFIDLELGVHRAAHAVSERQLEQAAAIPRLRACGGANPWPNPAIKGCRDQGACGNQNLHLRH